MWIAALSPEFTKRHRRELWMRSLHPPLDTDVLVAVLSCRLQTCDTVLGTVLRCCTKASVPWCSVHLMWRSKFRQWNDLGSIRACIVRALIRTSPKSVPILPRTARRRSVHHVGGGRTSTRILNFRSDGVRVHSCARCIPIRIFITISSVLDGGVLCNQRPRQGSGGKGRWCCRFMKVLRWRVQGQGSCMAVAVVPHRAL